MNNFFKRPQVQEVAVKDEFFTPYLDMIRNVTVPYMFYKFEEKGWIDNYKDHLDTIKNGTVHKHREVPFSTGLTLESLRGACDFLAASYDENMAKLVENFVNVVASVSEAEPDGFICSYTELGGEENKRFGMAGRSIIQSHDLYNLGCLIEAAVAHYNATGKTRLVEAAIKAAAYICREIGEAPKKEVIPGHSLPEEAMVKLYRLIRDERCLDAIAEKYGLTCDEIMRVVRFWYDDRGNSNKRNFGTTPQRFIGGYNQDHVTFKDQNTAEGHAVRAGLCYTGAAAYIREMWDEDYKKALDAIWRNIVDKKMHISGGIGTRHDIEGFDVDYNLPSNAYLETCASIALIFFAGEMALIEPKAEYYDVIERALYNTVLASIGEDGAHYFYQNPLKSGGTTVRRWNWHGCPCCPPMLLKLYSSLSTYIYTVKENTVNVNMFIGSTFEGDKYTVSQKDGKIKVNSMGEKLTVRVRIPEYAENMEFVLNGVTVKPAVTDGYAEFCRVWAEDDALECKYTVTPREVVANPEVTAVNGKVAVMYGPYLMCAEGYDNEFGVDFTVANDVRLTANGDEVCGITADGKIFRLIPYYRWSRRSDNLVGWDLYRKDLRSMNVWFDKENFTVKDTNGKLYMDL